MYLWTVRARGAVQRVRPAHRSLGLWPPALRRTWLAFPPGELQGGGGVIDEDAPLECFVPYVEQVRHEWFPQLNPALLQWTCDPAGQARSAHGTVNAVQVLRDFGIYPRVIADANTPPKCDFEIQTVNGYLARRRQNGAPMCAIDPRFVIVNAQGQRRRDPVLVDSVEVSCVWDDYHAYQGTQYANLRRPKKDDWYEHPFNTLEYGVFACAPPDPRLRSGCFAIGRQCVRPGGC